MQGRTCPFICSDGDGIWLEQTMISVLRDMWDHDSSLTRLLWVLIISISALLRFRSRCVCLYSNCILMKAVFITIGISHPPSPCLDRFWFYQKIWCKRSTGRQSENLCTPVIWILPFCKGISWWWQALGTNILRQWERKLRDYDSYR